MTGRILLVDDNEEFLDSIRDVLEDEGYEVAMANSGEKAIRLVSEEAFDVILMDIKMPGMDGVESFMEMKKLQPGVKVIMVTAYSVEALIRKALDEGAYGVMHKPLDMEAMFRNIEDARRNGKGGMVLIADDNRDLCDNLATLLRSDGYETVIAYDGEEAVAKAEERSFDILLLDMKLPLLNGMEVSRRVKVIQPNMVTILISGYAEEMHELIQQTLNEKAHTCLTKPLDMKRLLGLLEAVCRGKEEMRVQNSPR